MRESKIRTGDFAKACGKTRDMIRNDTQLGFSPFPNDDFEGTQRFYGASHIMAMTLRDQLVQVGFEKSAAASEIRYVWNDFVEAIGDLESTPDLDTVFAVKSMVVSEAGVAGPTTESRIMQIGNIPQFVEGGISNFGQIDLHVSLSEKREAHNTGPLSYHFVLLRDVRKKALETAFQNAFAIHGQNVYGASKCPFNLIDYAMAIKNMHVALPKASE